MNFNSKPAEKVGIADLNRRALSRMSKERENCCMSQTRRRTFLKRTVIVVAYAIAMAYLESAVVVYLQHALSMTPATLFPLREQGTLGGLGTIEVGREVATIVMLATLGWLAGRTSLERLAWTSVAFGIWDIGYYFWLWVYIGWPTSLGTTDLLFLLPVPWVAPVAAPIIVSLALIGFGLVAAIRLNRGEQVILEVKEWLTLLVGGLIVILSFTLNARHILNGGMPRSFSWPIFLIGMAVAGHGARSILLPKPKASVL